MKEFFIENDTRRVYAYINRRLSILNSFDDIDDSKYYIITDTEYDFYNVTIEEAEIIG